MSAPGPHMIQSAMRAMKSGAPVSLEPFEDIVGRHFRQPREGLGQDGSPVAHMWRTIANPARPL